MFRLALIAILAQDLSQSSVPSPQSSASITVTATRTPERLAGTPASVVILNRQTIAVAASPALDDTLRQVPGFTLFRRSGSRVANPTSQGVSLRGLGGSGASRALVLDDGVPLNDPFGGWIFWGRVPRASLDRIEVLRGGASDVYGSSAMGGVVQFVRRKDDFAMDVDGGSQRTAAASLFFPFTGGNWSGDVAGDFLTTDGYAIVDPAQRGPVDRNASSRHLGLDATVRREGFFIRAGRYTESRNNGTPLQINDTVIRQVAAGWDSSAWTVRLDGNDNNYHQTFSAIAASRASERLVSCGLPPLPHVTPHTLRRTYVSIMLVATNFDVPFVQSQVGHADSKMTMDVYAQLLDRGKRAHGAAFDALLQRAQGSLSGASAEGFSPPFSPPPRFSSPEPLAGKSESPPFAGE
ncbi:MAG TPA: TonB-dependent receptor plug domain-containing protein, partial [Thermoanaerobaculia bacterium]